MRLANRREPPNLIDGDSHLGRQRDLAESTNAIYIRYESAVQSGLEPRTPSFVLFPLSLPRN